MEFIRAGGLDEARQKEIAELEERRRRAKTEQVADAWETRSVLVAVNRDRSPGPRTSDFKLRPLKRAAVCAVYSSSRAAACL